MINPADMATSSLASFGFPYSYFSCPCSDADTNGGGAPRGAGADGEALGETERTFNPRNPRANYALYPLEHLMWCEDCHDIRCYRCTTEEIVCWYCPSCLFEVASGMVKSEGNRCTRNCHNCPICTAPMAVNSLDMEAGGMAGPWILACDYCGWTTRDIDIQFDRPNNIFGQLARIFGSSPASGSGRAERPRAARATALEPEAVDESTEAPPEPPKDHEARFKAMRGFYVEQLAKAGPGDPLMSPSGGFDYSSPSSLARIMSLYTSASTYGKKGAKPSPARAAMLPEEGVKLLSVADDLKSVLQVGEAGWAGTASAEQRRNQTHAQVRFLADLRPVPVLLRTKRSRRCRTCRHILVRPEAKVASTRYRIKLVAMNYVPTVTLTPIQAPAQGLVSGPSSTEAATSPTGSNAAPSQPSPSLDLNALPPSRPLQFVLTIRNPMFDAVRVTLATPSSLPGSPGSRVTILCPQFEVGANTDMWDEALRGTDGRRTAKGDGVAEAGKIWERGRNWTAVVLEVVAPRLKKSDPPQIPDEQVLEIPISFRIEYDADVGGDNNAALGETAEGDKDVKREKRELAYWCIVGVGKVARVDA